MRLTLAEKKIVVDTFYNFREANTTDCSINSFVKHYNQSETLPYGKLNSSGVGKWVQADKRGDYLSWNKCNKLSNKICFTSNILERINLKLEESAKRCATFSGVCRSSIKTKEFGVFALEYTLAGTFLGYYKGECVTGEQVENTRKYNYDNLMCVDKCRFIDAKGYDTCYARYYQRTSDKHLQKVCVKRLLSTNDPQRTICFITIKDVKEGDEFFIPFGSEFWEQNNATEGASTTSAAYQRVISKLLLKVPRKFAQELEESKYSNNEVQELATWFGDNHAFPAFADNSIESDEEC
jgi:hypothetical protein